MLKRIIRALPARRFASGSLHKESLQNPSVFWGNAAKEISWGSENGPILHEDGAFTRWFPERTLNMAHNCVFRHVKDRGSQTAIAYESPVTNTSTSISYTQLAAQVSEFANLLRLQGVTKGDRVLIYMPNIPEAAVAMLATAYLGAIHSVVFGGFAPAELAIRINDCAPKVIVLASCGIDGSKVIPYKPLVESALAIVAEKAASPQSPHTPPTSSSSPPPLSPPSTAVQKCIILQRQQCLSTGLVAGRDLEWQAACAAAAGSLAELGPPVLVKSTDPLYILYTSGTTGAPKGVLRDTGGYAVALKWSMWNIYGIKPGEVFWAASDVGWVVGHSYSTYGPLLNGNTTVLFEGKPVGTPDAAAFWRVIEKRKVSTLFTAPTAIRAIKRADHQGEQCAKHDISSLRALFLAGEHADPDTIKWAERILSVPVLDHWWQTETGWPICSNLVGAEGFQPVKYGSTFKPCPGYNLVALDKDHKSVKAGEMGTLAIRLPLPPGCLLGLYNADARYMSSYMASIPGYYDTGDAGIIDADGYVSVMSRTDDVINVAGHRLSTGAMEEILSEHPDVAEVAVVGIKDPLKGQLPIGLLVLYEKQDQRPHELIQKEVVAMIREKMGALACFKTAIVVQRLPKTRSGKVLRVTMRAMANGEKYSIPSTIDDPEVLTEMAAVIRSQESALAALHETSDK